MRELSNEEMKAVSGGAAFSLQLNPDQVSKWLNILSNVLKTISKTEGDIISNLR